MTTDESTVPGDDPEIPNDEVLYRRLPADDRNWLVRDSITGEPVRPTSGAFQPDSDGVSVYRDSILRVQNPPLDPANVALSAHNVIVSFTVGDVRSLSMGVKDDAWPPDVPNPKHPRNAAHALIVGWEELGKNARIRKQKEFAKLAFNFVYP